MWSAAQNKKAMSEGWMLADMYDKGELRFQVFAYDTRFSSNTAALRYVVEQARSKSQFHIDALKMVINSRIGNV